MSGSEQNKGGSWKDTAEKFFSSWEGKMPGGMDFVKRCCAGEACGNEWMEMCKRFMPQKNTDKNNSGDAETKSTEHPA